MPLSAADRASLAAQLEVDEAYKRFPYKDTVGKETIAIGRNLDDVGISYEEALYLLNNDITTAETELRKAFPWVDELDGIRLQVLTNMSFNLGIGKLAQFTATLAAVKAGDYAKAAAGMRNSLWYRQVGARGERLAKMMESGMLPPSTSANTIKTLQSALNKFGNYGLVVDGNIGKKTISAIKSFQASQGLKQTGEADAATWSALDKATA